MVTPVWRVDPTPFFELLRQYVEKLPEDPRVATRRAAQRRRRIAAQVRKNLSGKELKHFDDLLETASIYVRLREARAFWQVAALGVLGVPCRAAGARLVEAGVIDAVDDVFYLHLDDICEATDDPGSEKWTRLVAKRKTAYAKYRNTVPPLTVGAPFDGEVRQLQVQKGKFSGADSDQAADAGKRVIHGTAASRGTVCATARLIYSLDEAERLKEGEILICRTSSPPWTPLIARSAGVIAETGGVLMHCAIVTREYAIPCVVGVGPIDGRIKDGDTITIDGTQGIIRIE
jgi:pyruvate,water dikinase